MLIRPKNLPVLPLSRNGREHGRETGAKVHLGCTETEFTCDFLTGVYNFSLIGNV